MLEAYEDLKIPMTALLGKIRNIKLPCQNWFMTEKNGSCAIAYWSYCKKSEHQVMSLSQHNAASIYKFDSVANMVGEFLNYKDHG